MENIKELVDRRAELQAEIRDIDLALVEGIVHYEGTLLDALRAGLVRPNFPTPAGFKRWIREQR